ncbi:MAG TPA: hypothetical protein VFS35_02515, partial [Terrimicrobiaceae bacterium]|nr:hypothetical protein [Terrimicrobiaceae bacterium]
MKNGQIFAHKSTARGGLDLEYLDETSRRKVSLRERADMDQQIGKKLKHFTDYASKETLGQVHAGGFLHRSIRMNPDGTSTAPSQLSNPERKQRITEAWREHLAKFPSTAKSPVIAHRLVFSMSKEQHDVLTGAGINPDQVLHSTLKKVMRRFNERFHPNDSIGYAYGLHHDTANLHVHVAICPRTENGSYVGCSTSRSAQSRHKKQLDCIKLWFEAENSRWEKILCSPQKLEEILSKRLDADKLVFSQELNHLQITALQCAQNSDSIRLQQLYQSIRNLEASLANKRRGLGAQRDQRFVSRLLGHRQSKATPLVAQIGSAIERRSLREVQSLLFKLKRQYRTLHKRYSQIYGFSSYAHRNGMCYQAAVRQQN